MTATLPATTRQAGLLRTVLLVDAGLSAVAGLALAAGGGLVAELLGLPARLLMLTGLSFLPFAAVVAVVATRQRPPVAAVWAIIAYNALFAIECIAALAFGWITPTALGMAAVIGQAVIVLAFAEVETIALRRARAAA